MNATLLHVADHDGIEVSDWYAIVTRPRHEKVVVEQLEHCGVETFLPLCPRIRIWSDRRKMVDFPLFSSYVFVRTGRSHEERIRLLRTHGVVGFVGPQNRATPIPADQIENVRALIKAGLHYSLVPYGSSGQRIRVKSGALQGLEGTLVRVADDHSLILSIDLIQRSVAVQLHGYEVEILSRSSL